MFNSEQIKGIIERIVTVVVTYAVAKNWIPVGISDQVIAVVIGLVTIFLGWKLNTQPSLVAATQSLPDVKAVVTQPTAAGRELASAVPSDAVVPAGTAAAKAVAS